MIGRELSIEIAKVLVAVSTNRWRPAISADDSELCDHADVTEIADLH